VRNRYGSQWAASYFPATREKMAENLKRIPLDQYTGQGELILVVDDVAEQREVADGMLTSLGCGL
jgi:hypothetical protein